MKYISNVVAVVDKSIFNNILIIAGFAVTSFLSLGRFRNIGEIWRRFFFLGKLDGSLLPSLFVWIAQIVAVVYLKKTFDTPALTLNVIFLSNRVIFYLAGIITMISSVGRIFSMSGNVVLAAAFFSILEKILLIEKAGLSIHFDSKYCGNCGRKLSFDDNFCLKCGKQI